jgi:aromatic ring-cleaving dioxygenase
MTEPRIHDFHAHLYYDPAEVERARAVAAALTARFPDIPVGHFHLAPVGPHPRGSCQLTVPTALFGEVAGWLALNRDGITVFAHASTGDHLADHTDHVIWFGPSETLDLRMFG